MSSYLLLFLVAGAIASAWLHERVRLQVAAVAAGLAVCVGLLSDVLAPSAIMGLAILFGAAWWAGGERRGRGAGWAIFILFALGLGFGVFPGFSPIMFTDSVPIKPDSVPYSVQFGLGKPLVAVAMFLWLVPVARGWVAWQTLIRSALPVIAVTTVTVPLLAWGMGHIHPALELPPSHIALTWAAINLLLVCTTEEAFFRGVVQRGLAQVVRPPFAVGAAALLYGLAHFGGGWSYVLLATVAGFGYGLAYHRTGQRIEAAILTHFGVNLTHFALFTYPAG